MGRKQKGGGSLGSALKKDKNKSSVKKADYIKTHKQEDTGVDTKAKAKLVSVVERDDVNDFLYNAELKQQKFDVGDILISGGEAEKAHHYRLYWNPSGDRLGHRERRRSFR